MNKVIRGIVIFFFYLLFFPKVIGKSNIPKKGRVILAGNHTSNLDWGLLMISTKRPVHFLAKKELFKNHLLRYFLNKMGIIPVDRKNKNKEALAKAIEYLNNDNIVGLFPESTINRKKESAILPFKVGAVKMAYEASSPIVPFTIKGGFIPIFKRPIIEFYKPIYVKDNNIEEENQKFMNLIIKKLGEK